METEQPAMSSTTEPFAIAPRGFREIRLYSVWPLGASKMRIATKEKDVTMHPKSVFPCAPLDHVHLELAVRPEIIENTAPALLHSRVMAILSVKNVSIANTFTFSAVANKILLFLSSCAKRSSVPH